MNIEIVPADRRHAGALAPRLRRADRIESAAVTGLPPRGALLASLEVSERAWCALVDSEPAALYGWAPDTLPDRGIVWMLGSPAAVRSPRAFLSEARRFLREALVRFPDGVRNLVAVDNRAAVATVLHLGGTLAEDRVQRGGVELVLFEIKEVRGV